MDRISSSSPSLTRWILRGAFQYGSVFGTIVAILTTYINAADSGAAQLSLADSQLLYLYLFAFYGTMGAVCAAGGYVVTQVLSKLIRVDLNLPLLFTFLWFWPLLIITMLPDIAILSPYPFEYFWHTLHWPFQLLAIAVISTLFVLLYFALIRPLRIESIGLNSNLFNVFLFVLGIAAVAVANSHISHQNYDLESPSPVSPLAIGSASPLIVIGVDGLGKAAIDKHSTEVLPNLKHIFGSSCAYSLDGHYPGLTPKKWPVITTGARSRETGVHFYFSYKLPGLKSSIQRWPLETLTSLTALMYVDKYIDIAERMNCAHHLKAEPVWKEIEQRGLHASTVCWPNSKNCLEETTKHTTSCPKGDWTSTERIKEIADDALASIKSGHDLVMVYFSQLDTVSHDSCRESGDSAEVEQVIREIDRNIGRLISALPESGAVMIVSDHGFDYSICTHVLGVPAVAIVWKKQGDLNCVGPDSELSLRSIAPTIKELLLSN
ncbi:MAG: alkaline phosphatase family protein [Bdellovibrionales bacterium]|nr:alkaline phosphatase family protein [Bdellovibrionales bacterium]